MPRVLVTGGAGFIGSHLVDRLASSRLDVVVLDNLFSGSLKNIEAHSGIEGFSFVNGDVRDFDVLKPLVVDADCVVHLAAVTSVPLSLKDPSLAHEVNATGTLNLLRACLEGDVERFVFASSCAVYGEPRYIPIDEEHPTSPIAPYAASKLAAEHYLQAFHEAYGLRTVVLRLFNVYGSRQGLNGEGGVVAKFFESLRCRLPLPIYGDGTQTRDFVYVDDVVDAFILALKSANAVGEVFNIGSGTSTSVSGLAEKLLDLAGSNLGVVNEKPRLGDIKHSLANIEKAKKMQGYAPKTPLQEGLGSLLRKGVQSSR
jgi:UDP-glucose 4-epimerase